MIDVVLIQSLDSLDIIAILGLHSSNRIMLHSCSVRMLICERPDMMMRDTIIENLWAVVT
jgi:hypothetical protein